jgi:glycosyltransferase involved in cell wall biosynthesis
LSHNPQVGTTTFFTLWPNPLVFVISAGWGAAWGARMALRIADGRQCHILLRPADHMAALVDEIGHIDQWLRRDHPNVKLWSLAASEEDAALVAGRGVGAVWANNTAFIDERLYFPELEQPKLYDAVHNARTTAFKRHPLAHGVNNLALITFAIFGSDDSIADMARGYRSLSYVNYSNEHGHRRLDAAGVRRVLSQSRCGLLLSEREGATNATMEYFLCGIPLVTTPSEGGREAMYDPRHVSIVEPSPTAVEAAVAAFQTSAPNPLEIRAAALATARPHRARLIAWLSQIAGRDLLPLADGNLWLPHFRDKLRQVWKIEARPDGGWDARPTND